MEEAGEVMLKAQQLRPKDKHINRQLAVIDKWLGVVEGCMSGGRVDEWWRDG